ncbi:MAG: DNA-packaging protein [Methylocystis sp.]
MRTRDPSSLIDSLVSLPPEQRLRVLAGLSQSEARALLFDWRAWARPEQVAPQGSWSFWLVLAGRGFGKTRTGAEWVREKKEKCGRIALVAPTAGDARDVMVEGESGILACSPSWDRPRYEPSKRRVTWKNGARATLYSAEDPEALRGPQFSAAWADELCAWPYAQETWDMLQFGLRLGRNPQCAVTTTPKPIKVLKDLIVNPATVVTGGSTYANRANLAEGFFAQIIRRYEGTRLGRQELLAEILDDVPGALWTRAMFDKHRIRAAPELRRVVVAIDPSGASGDDDASNSIGIIGAGLGIDGRGYVLTDRTCSLSPAGWGRRAVDAYHEFKADRIVAEQNFGGAMVEHVIKTTDPKASFRAVVASRGKVVRAEPVAALYEQGRISHVGAFSDLEDQACQMTESGFVGDGSPDRVDALVWAITDLMFGEKPYGMLGVVG